MRLVAVVDDGFSDVGALRRQDHQERLHQSRRRCRSRQRAAIQNCLLLPLRPPEFADVIERYLAELIQQSPLALLF